MQQSLLSFFVKKSEEKHKVEIEDEEDKEVNLDSSLDMSVRLL